MERIEVPTYSSWGLYRLGQKLEGEAPTEGSHRGEAERRLGSIQELEQQVLLRRIGDEAPLARPLLDLLGRLDQHWLLFLLLLLLLSWALHGPTRGQE
jgi:hypothetical protein